MQTREEILDKHNSWCTMLSPVLISSSVAISAMEEYAKQEAMEFSLFTSKNRLKIIGGTYDKSWNEYQKSKVK